MGPRIKPPHSQPLLLHTGLQSQRMSESWTLQLGNDSTVITICEEQAGGHCQCLVIWYKTVPEILFLKFKKKFLGKWIFLLNSYKIQCAVRMQYHDFRKPTHSSGTIHNRPLGEVYACNPSSSGGWGTRPASQGQPGIQSEFCCSLGDIRADSLKSEKKNRATTQLSGRTFSKH